jgi:hypothetical protein
VAQFERTREPIQRAATVPEVERVVSAFVDSLLPSDLDALPQSCRQALRTDAIADAALVLIREELTFAGTPEARGFLHEVAHTFVAAANRIAQLNARSTA